MKYYNLRMSLGSGVLTYNLHHFSPFSKSGGSEIFYHIPLWCGCSKAPPGIYFVYCLGNISIKCILPWEYTIITSGKTQRCQGLKNFRSETYQQFVLDSSKHSIIFSNADKKTSNSIFRCEKQTVKLENRD